MGTTGEPGIALVPDGSGGSFVIWEDSGGAILRTQRLDLNGNPLWAGGVVSTNAAYQASPSAVSDGRGGMLVAWVDGRNGGCDSISQLSCALYSQRLGSDGSRLWGDDGMPVTMRAAYPAANRFAMISDGAQGAYLAWSSGADYYNCCSYYLQHIGSDGQPLWAANGIRVSELPTLTTGPGVTGPRLVSDAAGGAILSWWNQQSTDGSLRLMAQRVDPSGQFLWDSNGVQVPFTGSGHANYDSVPDKADGVIFAVQSNDVPNANRTHLYLQRVSGNGQVIWEPAGVQVSPAVGAQITPSLASDGAGGAFAAWSVFDLSLTKNNRIAVIHVDNAGHQAWSDATWVTATTIGQTNPHLLSDGNGGVMVGWSDCRGIAGTDCAGAYDLFAQRIDRNGQRIWAAEGFPVSVAKANQGVDYGGEKRPGYEMVSDGGSGVLVVWPEGRLKTCGAGITSACDLYAQHLLP